MRELPRELHRGCEDDDVQRHEQLVAERADAHGDARERKERQDPRLAPERGRKPGGDRERCERPADRLGVVVRRERGREHARAERGETEPCEPVAARPCQEQQRQPEARDRPRDAREPDHRTTTDAVSTWPRSLTVSRYVPIADGARSFSTRPEPVPARAPSVQ